jgi:hypothetical protein
LRRTDIAAVQEIRCKLIEVMSLKEYILINTRRKENDYGTGFMVRKRCKPNIMGYNLINEEICVLRIRGRLFNATSMHQRKEKIQKKKVNFMRIWNKYAIKLHRTIKII